MAVRRSWKTATQLLARAKDVVVQTFVTMEMEVLRKVATMRKGGSKQKGNSEERAVAKLLSAWWGEPFNRIPNSGALRWKANTFTYGDLLPPETCPVVVECKHYKDINLQGLLSHGRDNNSLILQWWTQVTDDVNREFFERSISPAASRVIEPLTPLLIVKSNRNDRMIILDERVAARCYAFKSMNSLDFLQMISEDMGLKTLQLTIFSLSEFLKHVTREQFLKARIQ